MAEACSIASLGQLACISDWHIRDETYALALRRLINQQQIESLAAMFGSGFASSSDGQFFQAGGFGRDASSINAHYGDQPGVNFYHARLRPLRTVPHQADRGDRQRSRVCP
jgi:TnpA family transposase